MDVQTGSGEAWLDPNRETEEEKADAGADAEKKGREQGCWKERKKQRNEPPAFKGS